MVLFMRTPKTFFIKTYGCASNIADSGFVKKLLICSGYKETDLKNANFVLVNTCTVKGPTVSKIKDYILKLALKKNKIIILGCLPCDKIFTKNFYKFSMVNSYNIDSIVSVCDKILKTNKSVHLLEPKFLDKTNLLCDFKTIAIVQPLIGCLGKCTFCKTRYAKPLFYSYPLSNIINRIDYYIKSGAKEIWLSSEDNAAYGKDLALNYMDLLNAIETRFKGKAMFRFGMSNPWLLQKYLLQLCDFFKKTKAFYRFLHIPIQSASNKVLKLMKRSYTEKVVNKIFTDLRNNFSYNELTIATDTIVGFPNETKKDFNKTKVFSKRYDILINNVSQFWPMSFTEAQKLKQLPTEIKKERSAILSTIARQESKRVLKTYVAKKVEVYFNDIDGKGNYLGRTRNYISVICKSSQKKQRLGEWVLQKIMAVEHYHLLC